MKKITSWMDRTFYPGVEKNWDDTLFRERILSVMKLEHDVLDVGAGAGIVEQMNFKGYARRVCGVDLDPRVVDNPMLDEGRVSDAGEIPYDAESFDVVFADNVLEHLDKPLEVFMEVARVLRPGGVFLFKTPNQFHYMPTLARITPHGFHRYVNKMRGREEVDTFPTRYRANSKGAVSRLAKGAGLEVVSVERVESRPEYMRMLPPAYAAGAVYERVVNTTDLLAPFRILLVGTVRKPLA